MKKLWEFISDHGGMILVFLVVFALVTCVFAPLLVAMGRYLWEAAIHNPASLINL